MRAEGSGDGAYGGHFTASDGTGIYAYGGGSYGGGSKPAARFENGMLQVVGAGGVQSVRVENGTVAIANGGLTMTGAATIGSTLAVSGASSFSAQMTTPGSGVLNHTSPAYSFISDTNTGMFNYAGDQIGFATNGALAAIIGNTGNFQIIGGTAYKPGGGSWTPTSDIRLKDVHDNYAYGLEAIMQIDPFWFNYKEGNPHGYDAGVTYAGVSAQALKEVIPEAVTEDDFGYYAINPDLIHWASVNAIKELKTENDELKSEIEDLKSRLEKVEEYLGL